MSLESATYLSDLNVSNPAAGDTVAQADDHLRMLKAVLKNTFPNINAPVNAYPLQLNEYFVPVGGIIMWSGSPSALPTGWKLCDGGTYAKSDGSGNLTAPDLRNRFILSCGGSTGAPTTANTVNSTGGANTATPTITVDSHTLTSAEMPVHTHTLNDPGHTHYVNDPGHAHTVPSVWIAQSGNSPYAAGGILGLGAQSTAAAATGVYLSGAYTGAWNSNAGSGGGHSHTASSSAISTIPVFYTLAFIIKV